MTIPMPEMNITMQIEHAADIASKFPSLMA